jgi:hypothetical protein
MITDTALNIVQNRDYRAEQFFHKYGSNGNVGATGETVWDAEGLYPWAAWDGAAQTVSCVSTSASDTSTLDIEGLDENLLFVSQRVTLTGITPVVSTQTFKRVFRLVYEGDSPNVGVISATTSISTTIVAQINIAKSQTLMAIFTIPSNYNGYLCRYTAGTGKAKETLIELYTRKLTNGGFKITSELAINNATAPQEFTVPLRLPPGTDIDFRAQTVGAGGSVVLNFDILLDS